RARYFASSATNGARVSRDLGKVAAARNKPAAPSRKTKYVSDFSHFSSGKCTGSSFGGAASPLRSSLRVFLHSVLVQPKYLPKRPDFNCISAPHLSHSINGPS